MHLVAVTGSGLRAVVTDRHRQEVKHQVWIVDVRVAAAEAAAFEVVRRAEPLALQQPLHPDAELLRPRDSGIDRDRQAVRELDVHLEMILQVGADARQVRDDGYAKGLE